MQARFMSVPLDLFVVLVSLLECQLRFMALSTGTLTLTHCAHTTRTAEVPLRQLSGTTQLFIPIIDVVGIEVTVDVGSRTIMTHEPEVVLDVETFTD